MKIKVLFAISAVVSTVVVSGSTNSIVNGIGNISSDTVEQKKSITEETLLDRLNRLDFNASVRDEKTIRLSINGGDVPVYVNAKAQRDVTGGVHYLAFKVYGKWYIPKTNQSLKLLHTKDSQESGWQLLPVGNGQCVVMYLQKIRNDVSDSKLVDAILSVQRIKLDQFPIRADDKYQKVWSAYLLGVAIYSLEIEDEKASKDEDDISGYCKRSPFNQTNHAKTIAMINDWDNMCPDDFCRLKN